MSAFLERERGEGHGASGRVGFVWRNLESSHAGVKCALSLFIVASGLEVSASILDSNSTLGSKSFIVEIGLLCCGCEQSGPYP